MRRTPSTTLRTLLRSPPRGAAIVEFALILPFLILLMVGLFDLGFGAYQTMQVHAAAEAGAQYAAIKYPGGNWTPGQITAIAAAVTSATGTSGIAATPAPSQVCGCPDGCFSAKTGQSVDCGGAPASGVPGKAGTPFRGIDSTPGLTSPLNEVITAWTP